MKTRRQLAGLAAARELKKTYVQIRTREVQSERGAPRGCEATLVAPGASALFDLFGLTELTPQGMRNYAQAMQAHPETWAAWEARRGTLHGKIRTSMTRGLTCAAAETAARKLAEKRGYVVVDAALLARGLPLDDLAGARPRARGRRRKR